MDKLVRITKTINRSPAVCALKRVGRKNLGFCFFVGMVAGLAAQRAHAAAAVDADVQDILTTASLTWTAAKTVLLTILTFLVGLKIALMGLKRIKG